jgi:hypothetical protein
MEYTQNYYDVVLVVVFTALAFTYLVFKGDN